MTHAVLGLFIGAVLVRYASYHWVFWFAAIVATPVAVSCLLAIPPEVAKSKDEPGPRSAKWERLDPIGISILTGVSSSWNTTVFVADTTPAAFILFIYAVTSGSANGWATAGVITPLAISILLIVGFFYWETFIPIDKAAMYVTPSFNHVRELIVFAA